MPESGKPDRWNSLLETLGVPAGETKPAEPARDVGAEEAPAVPPAKSQPISMLRPEKPKAASKPKVAAPAAKSPSYWSRIAGALGLEVPAASEPPAAEEPKVQRTEEPKVQRTEEPKVQRSEEPKHTREEPRHAPPPPEPPRPRDLPPRAFERPPRESRAPREEQRREESRREESRREEPPRREQRSRGGSGQPSPLDEMFGDKPADVNVFGLGIEPSAERVGEPRTGRDRETDETGSVLDYDLPDESGSDLSLGEKPLRHGESRGGEPRGGESRGIESSGEDEPDRGVRRRRRRRGRGRRGRPEGREAAAGPREADMEPAGEEADFDLERDAELDRDLDLDAELDEQDVPPRPVDRGPYRQRVEESERYTPGGQRPSREGGEREGRQRRHRRGGGGRSHDQPPPHRASYEAEDDVHERFERPAEQRGPAPRSVRPADEEPDDDLRDAVEEGDEAQGGDVPTHKKIPTWDEAVGMLIEANMANRGPDRDRGHGRGRGRR